MSKESFKQPIKREEPPIKEMKEKLDKAEKMVERVKERWKEKIEEFEIIEKSVEELKKLWERNKEDIKKIEVGNEIEVFSFISSLPLPEIPPFLLERTSNKFLKEFDWKKFEKEESRKLGFFLSAFLKKNIENYVSSQKKRGIKEKNIKPIEVRLDVKELPVWLDGLGFKNPKKLHLIIEGNCGNEVGVAMEGGEITIEGNCFEDIGWVMKDGKIVIKGGCLSGVGTGMEGGEIIVEKGEYAPGVVGYGMTNGKIILKEKAGDGVGQGMRGGEIIAKGGCLSMAGEEMEGGKLILEGECGGTPGEKMRDGILIVKGKTRDFPKSAFSPNNKGTIIWKNTKIWENGNWTKEGKEMWERGEIPVEG